jgi:hypothetical protein
MHNIPDSFESRIITRREMMTKDHGPMGYYNRGLCTLVSGEVWSWSFVAELTDCWVCLSYSDLLDRDTNKRAIHPSTRKPTPI